MSEHAHPEVLVDTHWLLDHLCGVPSLISCDQISVLISIRLPSKLALTIRYFAGNNCNCLWEF